MGTKSPPLPSDPLALLAVAEAGGPEAAAAARRAAWLAERADRGLARRALALTLRLDPLDPAPRLALARLAAEDGNLDDAVAEAEAVLADAVDKAARARAAFMLGEIARVRGERAKARAHFLEASRIEEAILTVSRGDSTATRWYARARGRIADLDLEEGARDSAFVGAEGALAILRASAATAGEPPVLAADIADAEVRLGGLELETRQPASARRRFGEAIGRYEALAITEPDEPHWRAALADTWTLAAEAEFMRGASDQAREAMDKALHARIRVAVRHNEEAWALAGTWRVRGGLRAALGDDATAMESFEQASKLATLLADRGKEAPAPARFLVHTLLDQADHALRTRAMEIAYQAANAARARAERFAHRENDPTWLSEAGACWDRLGEAARLSKAHDEARDAFARASEFRRMAASRAPDNPALKAGFAAALLKQGDVALAADALSEARECFGACVSVRTALFEARRDPQSAHALAAALERVGLVALAQADPNAARDAWEAELKLIDTVFPNSVLPEAIRFRAIVESHLAGAGGANAGAYRRAALARLDTLSRTCGLSEAEAALLRRLEA